MDRHDSKTLLKINTLDKYTLQEAMNTFEDVVKIRSEPELLMVGNGKVLKHTGDLNSDIMKRLVQSATAKKWLD